MKETKELFKGLGALAGEIHEISKDGFQVTDLMNLMDVANDFEIYKDAVEGLSEVKKEIKEAKPEDVVALVMEFLEGLEQGKK